jgi:hypothetical protein
MNTSHRPALAVLDGKEFQGWIVLVTALLSFAAGSFATLRLTRLSQVRADRNHVFELNVYHAVRGKVPALVDRFSDASKLIAKHNLNVVGYWVPDSDPAFADTFIYIVAASSREEMEKNWNAFHADPEFQKYRKSEEAVKLIEKVDSTYMRPTDFSVMK